MSFFAELKRRNVIRMAGLYLVGAWLIAQVAETILPAFDVPNWVMRAIIIALALGFLPAVIFAWVFELTPGGIRRDEEVDPAQSIAPHTARRMDRMLLLVSVLALCYFAVDKFVFAPQRDVELVAQTTETVGAAAEAKKSTSDEISIAVLPFVNMSTDTENGFFADGISEELLNVLARIDGLTVASRTSAFSFKGKDTPIPEIARLLNVRNVLEGSVRKQGNRVRITAQLIRAGTDKHLWSQTYDRDLTDIFKVQEEIAQAISTELMGVLPIGGVAVQPSTSNFDAYEKFLSGRARFFQRTELNTAVADLQFAVDKDPNLAEAWVYLAATYSVLDGYEAVDSKERVDKMASALRRASALAPKHLMVMAVEAVKARDADDYMSSIAQMERAAAVRSPDSTAVLWYGIELLFAGYLDQARIVLERAQKMDPLSGINNGYLGMALLALGKEESGAMALKRAAELGWQPGMRTYLADLMARGERKRALELLDAQKKDDKDTDAFKAFRQAVIEPNEANDFLATFKDAPPLELLRAFGRKGEALDILEERANDQASAIDFWFLMRTVWLPSASDLREDPRLFKIAEKRGLVKLWESRGYPPGCSRVRAPAGDHLECSGMHQ